MSTDIVERLRADREVITGVTEFGTVKGDFAPPSATDLEAADLISSLRQEVRGLEDQQWEFTSLLSDGANREKALRQEVETLREALLRRVQEDNAFQFSGKWMGHSRPIGGPPCGPEGGSWNSQKCGCAEEARALLPKDKP